MATVRIDIQAETQQFQAAMRQCSAEMKQLSSEYSLAAAQAKLSGSAQDTLRAKVTELTGKVSLQKDIVQKNETYHQKLKQALEQQKTTHDQLKTKVEAAKKAYEESAKATGENSEQTKKLKAEYEKLKSELENTERSIQKTETKITKQEAAVTSSKAKLAELEVQLRNVNAEMARAPFDAYAEKAGKIGGTITKVGEAIMPASMATVGLGAAAVKTAANFDTSMSQVQATMGLTSDSTSKLNGETVNTMDALSKLARTMGKDTKFSASEAADAINILAMRGGGRDQHPGHGRHGYRRHLFRPACDAESGGRGKHGNRAGGRLCDGHHVRLRHEDAGRFEGGRRSGRNGFQRQRLRRSVRRRSCAGCRPGIHNRAVVRRYSNGPGDPGKS